MPSHGVLTPIHNPIHLKKRHLKSLEHGKTCKKPSVLSSFGAKALAIFANQKMITSFCKWSSWCQEQLCQKMLKVSLPPDFFLFYRLELILLKSSLISYVLLWYPRFLSDKGHQHGQHSFPLSAVSAPHESWNIHKFSTNETWQCLAINTTWREIVTC